MLRRNAIPSIMCVFWVIAIVGVCYYTTVVLGSTNNSDPNTIQVDYEYGFYTITGAGEFSFVYCLKTFYYFIKCTEQFLTGNIIKRN